jgi:protein-L-isoaspartate O-methyltransferase
VTKTFNSAVTRRRFLAVACAACFAAAPLHAQDYGDTPYVQTPQNVVDKMLEVAKVGPKDFVIDLGSGDGRMVITAAKKYGARGFGVDLDRRLVTLANRNAAKAGVADRAVFYERDIYQTDVSPATVVTIYLLPEVNLMMRPILLSKLKPGTRVVSHDYDMGEWPPDLSLTMDAPGKPVGRDQKSKVFYWVIPGRASGRWMWQSSLEGGAPRTFELALNQNFQMIDGTLTADGKTVPIEEAKLVGDRVSFVAKLGEEVGRYEFDGHLFNNALDGTMRLQRTGAPAREQPWSAARTELWEPRHFTLPPPTLIPPQ